MALTVIDTDLPALYQAADAASLEGQRLYVALFRLNLGLLVGAAAIGAFVLKTPTWHLASVTCLLFVLSIIVGLVMRVQGYERVWFEGRAVAESAKSMAWKYMMRAPPYQEEAEALLLDDLSKVLAQAKHLHFAPASSNESPQITQQMKTACAANLDARRDCYLKDRIDNQRKWYSRKAAYNARRQNQFLYSALILQGVGIILSVVRIGVDLPFRFEAVVASIVAAMLAWLQLRRFHELSQSYAMASQELGMVEASVDGIRTNEEFAQFVADAETAMSREHTMWRARREIK